MKSSENVLRDSFPPSDKKDERRGSFSQERERTNLVDQNIFKDDVEIKSRKRPDKLKDIGRSKTVALAEVNSAIKQEFFTIASLKKM